MDSRSHCERLHLLSSDQLHAGAPQLVALRLDCGSQGFRPNQQPVLPRSLLPVRHHRRTRLPRPGHGHGGEQRYIPACRRGGTKTLHRIWWPGETQQAVRPCSTAAVGKPAFLGLSSCSWPHGRAVSVLQPPDAKALATRDRAAMMRWVQRRFARVKDLLTSCQIPQRSPRAPGQQVHCCSPPAHVKRS